MTSTAEQFDTTQRSNAADVRARGAADQMWQKVAEDLEKSSSSTSARPTMTDLAGMIVFRTPATAANDSGAEAGEPLRQWSADYLRARERAERAAAKHAQSLAARHAHQELAQHYAELLRRSA